tara:strand:- start:3032 stop:4675 length:1644 start_codon:yes stop_codon:yes gene_type:complete
MASRPEQFNRSWDAIVVGSGASGGVAALTLAEQGARVLVVEAGPDLSEGEAFGNEPANMWRRLTGITSGRHRRQAQHPGFWKTNPRLYADEQLHPYEHPPQRPFLWTRGLQVGGRSLTWGGITLRLSDEDFAGVCVDGEVTDWPIRLSDLAEHYGALESMLGVYGARDNLAHLPDGEMKVALPLTEAETCFAGEVRQQLGYEVIQSRGFAPHDPDRDGAWPRSSSRGSTLPQAMATGRVDLLSDHMVERLVMAADGATATGVIAVNQQDGSREVYKSALIVLCSSTIQSVAVLLRSSEQYQSGGFVDPSGRLGTRLMDHVSTSQFFSLPGGAPKPQMPLSGAGSFFLPFGRHLDGVDFEGGYGLWGGISRFDPPNWLMRQQNRTIGFLIGHGEVLPRASNQVSLSDKVDRWGIAIPHIDCCWSKNELAMTAHMRRTIAACIQAAGGQAQPIQDLFRLPLIEPFLKGAVALSDQAAPPGYYIHELGGAPMGNCEQTSVVDERNRLWRVRNVLVVDGACWPTSAWQSPTLTMMAVTRRACLTAVNSLVE